MRPGRLDRILYVSPPDLQSRKKIFEVNFSKMAVHDDVQVDELAILVSADSRTFSILITDYFERLLVAQELRSFRFVKMLH